MKKIAVTGFRGQIGRRLVSLFGFPFDANILDKDSIHREMKIVQPDIIIHCAGISSIQECEKDYEKAMAVNVWGTSALCEVAENKVVLLSSEQVFNGKKAMNTEADEPDPINVYGLSKYAAEGVAGAFGGKVIRLSRGFSNKVGSDIYKYKEDLKMDKKIIVPDFIFRNYCHLNLLTVGINEFANRFDEMPKLLNLGGTQIFSFYEMMRLVAKAMNKDAENVIARSVPEPEFPRPFLGGLDISLARHLKIPVYGIEQSIDLFLKEEPHDR